MLVDFIETEMGEKAQESWDLGRDMCCIAAFLCYFNKIHQHICIVTNARNFGDQFCFRKSTDRVFCTIMFTGSSPFTKNILQMQSLCSYMWELDKCYDENNNSVYYEIKLK